jgi:hypothetical protein
LYPIPESFWKNFTADIFLGLTAPEALGNLPGFSFLTYDADVYLDSLGKKDVIGKSKACLLFMMFALLNHLYYSLLE